MIRPTLPKISGRGCCHCYSRALDCISLFIPNNFLPYFIIQKRIRLCEIFEWQEELDFITFSLLTAPRVQDSDRYNSITTSKRNFICVGLSFFILFFYVLLCHISVIVPRISHYSLQRVRREKKNTLKNKKKEKKIEWRRRWRKRRRGGAGGEEAGVKEEEEDIFVDFITSNF